MAGNATVRVADSVPGVLHDRHSGAADVPPSARANALRFAMVPVGGAVLVSVDLLDRQSAAGLFPGARSAAGGGGLVVHRQPDDDLVWVHRSGSDLLLPAQAARGPGSLPLSRYGRVLDACIV